MKNNTASLSIVGIIVFSGSIFCVTSVEKDAYKLAVQRNVAEIEKDQLVVQHKQARKNLFQQNQQREVVGDNMGFTKKWLWNTAKIVGTVALTGFAVYSFFQASPAKIINPPTVNVTPKISLEQYEKYKNASNAYGTATVWFSLAAFINPVFVPYAMATYLGSVYYGVKALQPNFKLKPISLEHIKIIPEELPY